MSTSSGSLHKLETVETVDAVGCHTGDFPRGVGPRIIGSGIRIKLGIWRVNLEDQHLASSLVAEDPGELGELPH